MKRKAEKKASRFWGVFYCCVCCGTTKAETMSRNGRRRQRVQVKTELIEKCVDLNAFNKESDNQSCMEENGSPETMKNFSDNESGYLSVDDCKSQPYYPTEPSPQLSCVLEEYQVQVHWPNIPVQYLPTSEGQHIAVIEKEIFGHLNLLEPSQSRGEVCTTTDMGADDPKRLEVMKALTGLWGSSRRSKKASGASALSPVLAQYLKSTTTPLTSNIENLSMTSDMIEFLQEPEERLFVELCDHGKEKGDQRYKAKWEITGEHGNVLDEGTWITNDSEW